MITYVNTVMVGKGKNATVLTSASAVQDVASKHAISSQYGSYIVERVDSEKFRVGIVTKNNVEARVNGVLTFKPIIKWSNDIRIADIKSFTKSSYFADTEDKVIIEFNKAALAAANEDVRVVVRLTFKDMPTRYRKWTESYEVFAAKGATATEIATAMKAEMDRNYKRARVYSKVEGATLVLEAMPYDDDDTVDSISPANKIRFNANAWYTLPNADGWESKNKYNAATITKVPGEQYTASAKLVRDAEAQAMGYNGIINRGPGTWPIIKPEMETELDKNYDTLTLEFENLYRTADDLQRRTKQTLQVYDVTGTLGKLETAIEGMIGTLPTVTEASAELDAHVDSNSNGNYHVNA